MNLYGYVGENPVLMTDPYGWKTFSCKKPLSIGGTGSRSGPDVPGNPLYHQYTCTLDSSGKMVCGGQDRRGSALGSPGKPSNDSYDSRYCEEELDDYSCYEQCLQDEWVKPRPKYGIPLGTDCQEYDDDINKKCRQRCGVG